MFSVVAVKSRTSSSLPCSANEQTCRSQEGAQPGSQPRLASRSTRYRGHNAQCMDGGWPGGAGILSFPWVWQVLRNSPVLQNLRNSWALGNPQVPWSLLRTGYTIGRQAVRKTVLCIACFAYSLVVVVLLALLFPLLSYKTVLTHELYCFWFSSPSHWGAEQQVSAGVVLAASWQGEPRRGRGEKSLANLSEITAEFPSWENTKFLRCEDCQVDFKGTKVSIFSV